MQKMLEIMFAKKICGNVCECVWRRVRGFVDRLDSGVLWA